jgi:putative DNA primase/helicase
MSETGPLLLEAESARMGWLTVSGADLLDEAEAFTVWTSSHQIRDLIRAALVKAADPSIIGRLCARIAARTQINEAVVRDLAQLIARNQRLRPADAPSQLAKRLLRELFADGSALVSTVRGELHGYDGRMWRALPDMELERLLMELVLSRPEMIVGRAPHPAVRAAVRLLKVLQTRLAPWEQGGGPGCIINTLSGELWIDEQAEVQLRPHRPESGLRAVVPVEYDPAATCPRFDNAVADIFGRAADPSEMVRHMLEVMGYAIQPKRDIPSIICLVGGGANGKTSLLSLLQTLVGADQVYAGSGGALSDRFTLPNLAGRLLYVDDDLSEGTRLNDGLLKQMAEDKLMTARRAHASGSVTFRASALPILAMNGAPRLNDSSFGLLRRLYVIPFDHRFEAHEQDRGLFEHIRSHELPGVLNRCLEALQRLRIRGHFQEPPDCLIAKAEWIEAANPLQGFLADACKAAPRGRATLGDLHAAMAAWCRSEKLPMRLTRKTMARQLRSAGYQVDKVAGLARVRGLALKTPPGPHP